MGFKLGYIGFGEAAYNMGKGLKKEGFEDICAFDVALNMGGAVKTCSFTVRKTRA